MQISVIQALLLGFFCFLISTGMFPLGWLSMNIMKKPLIPCLIIGIIMGNTKDALIIGSVIQAAYIGQMSIGGVQTLPNIDTSIWFALPLILVAGGDAAQTLTICLAFAAVAQIIKTIGNLVKVGFLHRQDALIEQGKIQLAWWYPVLGHVWTLIYCMAIVPTIVLLGSQVVIDFVAALPAEINGITNTFTGLLPAIGFMMLMASMIRNNFQWIYFIFGFILAAGLGWSTTSITIIGCVIAYLIFQFTPKMATAVAEGDDD